MDERRCNLIRPENQAIINFRENKIITILENNLDQIKQSTNLTRKSSRCPPTDRLQKIHKRGHHSSPL